MIRSFSSTETEHIWHEQYVTSVDLTVQRAPLRNPELIHAAKDKDVEDVWIPLGNRLERLVEDRCGQDGIRVNAQSRLCLVRRDGGADNVAAITPLKVA